MQPDPPTTARPVQRTDRASARLSSLRHLAEPAFHAKHPFIASLCLAYIGFAAVMWTDRFVQVLRGSFSTRLIMIFPLVVICLAGIAIYRSPRHPLAAFAKKLRQRGLQGALFLVCFIVFTDAYTTIKISIPEMVAFYADSAAANIDLTLLGGDAWQLTRQLLPLAESYPLVLLYSDFWFVTWLGMVTFSVFWTNRAAANRYLAAMALTVICCGSILATLLSSVGPIFFDQFYGGNRFAGLTASLSASSVDQQILLYANFLYSAYVAGNPEIGTGISATPSMHVAISTLNAIYLTSLNRWLGAVAWAYAVCVAFGSVYFGWHYAVDGCISVAAVCLIWWLTGRSEAAALP